MAINIYELETLVRFSVAFTTTATGLAGDPAAVTLWMLDPNGVQSSFTWAGGQIVRDGVGAYHLDFAPDVTGRWTYKWQGALPIEVTSPDQYFIVNQTAFSSI